MTSIIEKTVAILAPHQCMMCGIYDNIVCAECIKSLSNFTHPLCLLCGAKNNEWRPCNACKPATQLSGLYAYAAYNDNLGDLIKQYKFDFARAAAQPLCGLLDDCVPALNDWHVAYIPTAAPRVRWRGYDQAKLLAKTFARRRGLPFLKNALARQHNLRQVGANRSTRQVQAQMLFRVPKQTDVKGKNILIVDDVCTTGATFSAAAETLIGAGAAQVMAVAVAWQPKNSASTKQK